MASGKTFLHNYHRLAHPVFSAGLVGDDIFNWEVIIIGPPETPYEGKYKKEI